MGPVSGLIGMLHTMGVKTDKLHKWEVTSSPGELILPSFLECQEKQLACEKALMELAVQGLWSKTATHQSSAELSQEVCDLFSFGHYRKLSKSNPKHAGMCLTFMADAVWTGERRFQCGLADTPKCLRCGADVETL